MRSVTNAEIRPQCAAAPPPPPSNKQTNGADFKQLLAVLDPLIFIDGEAAVERTFDAIADSDGSLKPAACWRWVADKYLALRL